MPAESALSLVERLRAALDRAEEIAHSMPPFPWRFDDDGGDVLAADGVVVAEPWALSTGQQQRVGRFIAANGPDVVLRTVAAHRKIIELHQGSHECSQYRGDDIDRCTWVLDDEVCSTLAAVAAVYFPEAPDA